MKFSRIGSEARKALVAALIAGVVLGHSPACRAQESEAAMAEALFQEGRVLLERGEYDAACAKLGESYRLDAASGTLLNLALCHERQGKLATAWAEYRSALSRVRREGRQERVEFAQQAIQRVEPRLARINLEVAAPPGVEVQIALGNTNLGKGAWGTPMPVDPGPLVIQATAPGYRPFETQIIFVEGETTLVQIPALVAEAPAPGGKGAASTPSEAPKSAGQDAIIADSSSGGGRRVGAYIAGGVGLVGLAAGSYLGLLAIQQRKQSDPDCNADGCLPEAQALYETAQRNATFSNVGFGVGLVGLGVATYLFLTSGDGSPSTPPVSRKTHAASDQQRSPAGQIAWTLVPQIELNRAGAVVAGSF